MGWTAGLLPNYKVLATDRRHVPDCATQQIETDRQGQVMNGLPVLSKSPSRSELAAYFAAAEKINNDLWAKAIARDKLKKVSKRKVAAPRACG